MENNNNKLNVKNVTLKQVLLYIALFGLGILATKYNLSDGVVQTITDILNAILGGDAAPVASMLGF